MLEAKIHELIQAYVPHPRRQKLGRIASEFNVLPVYSDMGGDLFITPQGDVLVIDLDRPELQPETKPEWRIIALVFASRLYPELAPLLPPRPLDAPNCGACHGRGYLDDGDYDNSTCGMCHGLGWLGAP